MLKITSGTVVPYDVIFAPLRSRQTSPNAGRKMASDRKVKFTESDIKSFTEVKAIQVFFFQSRPKREKLMKFLLPGCKSLHIKVFAFGSVAFVFILKRTLRVGSKILILCSSRGKNNILSPPCYILYLFQYIFIYY